MCKLSGQAKPLAEVVSYIYIDICTIVACTSETNWIVKKKTFKNALWQYNCTIDNIELYREILSRGVIIVYNLQTRPIKGIFVYKSLVTTLTGIFV